MLHAFLVANHDEIVSRAQARVALRKVPLTSDAERKHGIPVFLRQLGDALSLASVQGDVNHEAIVASAAEHGQALLQIGLTVGQVVHDYGRVCQIVTELVVEQAGAIPVDEFRTLNLCLDDAIAGAVTAYALQVEHTASAAETERLGAFGHELRNLLNVALISFDTIRSGIVTPSGSTGAMHARSLIRLRELVDRSLSEVRLDSGIQHLERVSLASFLADVELGAAIEAEAKGIRLLVGRVDPALLVDADRQTLASAVTNLLQNAIKFTRPAGQVRLTTRATAEHISIEVEDECGGLPPGSAEELFRPFEQRSANRSGLGLGLSICTRVATAHGGSIRVRDLPGKGCRFTLVLPNRTTSPTGDVA